MDKLHFMFSFMWIWKKKHWLSLLRVTAGHNPTHYRRITSNINNKSPVCFIINKCILPWFLPLGLSGRRGIVVTHVCLSVCPSVRPSVRLSVCYLKLVRAISQTQIDWWKFTKLAHKMYLGKLKFPIVFERSRSKVKVTRGQKVKNFDRPYLENYWADSLQTKTKMYS